MYYSAIKKYYACHQKCFFSEQPALFPGTMALTGSQRSRMRQLVFLSMIVPSLLLCATKADIEALRKRAQALEKTKELTSISNRYAMQKQARSSADRRENDTDATMKLMKNRAYLSAKSGAEKGNANAQFSLGGIYYHGIFSDKDYDKAIEWFTKAAAQGHTKAEYNLGDIYYHGRGVAVDYKKSYEWFLRAADDGDSKARLYLARMNYEGLGVAQDYEEAFSWFKKLADDDFPEAQKMVGQMYWQGVGVTKNKEMAYFYLEKSSMQSYGEAQHQLASYYLQTGDADEDKIKKLLQEAYLNGISDAKETLEEHHWEIKK